MLSDPAAGVSPAASASSTSASAPAAGDGASDDSVAVNLIRQWCYCPRVVYYLEMLGLPVERPRWVEQGESFHRREELLWKRRNLSRFKLQEGEKHYDLPLASARLALHGVVDMAIATADAVYAVEFKLSASNKKRGDILQLVAYGMLLEEHFGKPCKVGFLVGQGRVLHQVAVDAERRAQVARVAGEIRQTLQRGAKPESSATVVQCCNCEFLNYCNDRI